MRKQGLLAISIAVALMVVGDASGQDPGFQDSLIIGNLDGSIIPASLNQEVIIPVWVKTDDSVTFVHIPVATDNDYIAGRSGGIFYPPMSLWDDIRFLAPDFNQPFQGFTNQSILGFAYLSNPRDPQNFLHTNYQWVHVADFTMLTTADSSVLGETTTFIEGYNPAVGDQVWILVDGVTQVFPATVYPRIFFTNNMEPEFSEPGSDLTLNINTEFRIEFFVTVSDADGDSIDLQVSFPGANYSFTTMEREPGHVRSRFRWTPGRDVDGQFVALFTADDGRGGISQLQVTLNVTPTILQIPEIFGFGGEMILVPVYLKNTGITSYVGGFDLFVGYGEEMLDFRRVIRAPRINNWEYFNYSLCDSSKIRIVGLADISHRGNGLPPGDAPIVFLEFQLCPDDIYIGQYDDIFFLNEDENDNTITDTTGYILIHPRLDDGYVYNMDPDSVLIGDINLNYIPWEVSDAVLLANHFIRPNSYPFNPAQVRASDTNGDGIPRTLPDLVFLINVLNGTIPPPRLGIGDSHKSEITIVRGQANPDGFSLRYDSAIPAGAVLIRLDHRGGSLGIPRTPTDMTLIYNDDNGVLSLLLYDLGGNYINPGETLIEFDEPSAGITPVFAEIQVSDRYGYFMLVGGIDEVGRPETFSLYGAYPNPFNSSAAIRFYLPSQSDVELTIFNVLGQVVKTVYDKNVAAGENTIVWNGVADDGREVSSGIYLYSIRAGGSEAKSRMVLLK